MFLSIFLLYQVNLDKQIFICNFLFNILILLSLTPTFIIYFKNFFLHIQKFIFQIRKNLHVFLIISIKLIIGKKKTFMIFLTDLYIFY